jgi:hypothetical protein
MDNRWVVPYNPYLCLKYNAHINVEICSSVQSVKYIYKYDFKGHDRAAMHVQPTVPAGGEGVAAAVAPAVDEIKNYVDGRYVSASEACHRCFSFELHREWPNVYRLAVHCEGEHVITYNTEGNPDVEGVLFQDDRVACPLAPISKKSDSTLMAWMKMNAHLAATDRNNRALQTLYGDFPSVASYSKQLKKWKVVDEGTRRDTVGRMYYVPPIQIERFHLRLLLLHVPGATCFADLRTTHRGTPDEVVHPTFKAACIARGLLEDDDEWDRCLSEGVLVRCNLLWLLRVVVDDHFVRIADGVSEAIAPDVCHHTCLQQCTRAAAVVGEVSS